MDQEPQHRLCKTQNLRIVMNLQQATSALAHISSQDRDTWVRHGMALKSEFGEDARDAWMDWSGESANFNESSARSVWRSFKGHGITIASLYKEARQNGWRDDGCRTPDPQQSAAHRKAVEYKLAQERQERAKQAAEAARKAVWILGQCQPEKHAYLHSKGFPELQGRVWRPSEDVNLLCIPMRVNHQVVGLQMIDKYGTKKYLTGQVTSDAQHCISQDSASATDWWVEGYATGLSLQACLQALKLKHRVHITFSANNLKRMANVGYVVADKDDSDTGEKAAQATGLPYWIGDSGDFNDMHKSAGTFKASQTLSKWLRETRTPK